MLPSHLVAPFGSCTLVGSGQPSRILYPVLQYSLLSVPHPARRRDLSGPREHLKPFGPTDWLSKVHRILFSTCPQGLTYRPIWPNRQSPVPVYRSGLTGNRSEPIKFKFEFKSRREIGLDRLTDRLDRFTGRFDRFTGRFDW